jgi:2-phosphosulfolactate phosphatase
MSTSIEVTFTPADFGALKDRDLSETTCVVFDIFRATSTMMTAFSNGAEAVIPVATIEEAVALKTGRPEVILAGERDGVRISAALSGGTEFDLGNSPLEFTEDKVAGKTSVSTTTNGTRALRACAGARDTLIASFMNLRSISTWIESNNVKQLVLVCSGTEEEAAYEDMLGAGALADMVWPHFVTGHISDSAEIARQTYRIMQRDIPSAMQYARNGRRLLSIPQLKDDVHACVQRETLRIVAGMNKSGEIRVISSE